RLHGELREIKHDMIRLLSAALEAGNKAVAEGNEQYIISGERNLFSVLAVSQDVTRLKQLFELFERKSSLIQILDLSLRGQGVQIFIGGESGVSAPDDVSVVTSPYKVDGEVVGTVGVIGPTRMAYDRVIPIVDITGRPHGSGGARLSERIPLRPARGRTAARALVADPARDRASHPAGKIGREV